MTVAKLGPWIEANSWQIITAIAMAILGAAGAYLAGQNATQMEIHKLTLRVSDLEGIAQSQAKSLAVHDRSLDDRIDFMTCAVRSIDQMQDELGIRSRCEMRVAK